MTQINLEEVKKQAVHDGILEAICLLRETRNKVNSLILDEEVTCVIDAEDQLIRMSNSLCNFTTELSGIVGVIFSDRADEAIGKALKLNMQHDYPKAARTTLKDCLY